MLTHHFELCAYTKMTVRCSFLTHSLTHSLTQLETRSLIPTQTHSPSNLKAIWVEMSIIDPSKGWIASRGLRGGGVAA